MLTKQALGIGILIALLATACAPQVQVKGEAKGNGIGNGAQIGKDGKAAVGEGLNKITANTSDEDGAKEDAENGEANPKDERDQLAAKMMKDPDLRTLIKKIEGELKADCMFPRKNQVHAGCTEAACGVSLDITCASRIDVAANAENNDLYRISVPGEIDFAKKTSKWDLDKTIVKKVAVKAEDWKEVK